MKNKVDRLSDDEVTGLFSPFFWHIKIKLETTIEVCSIYFYLMCDFIKNSKKSYQKKAVK
jgi:hypothetical protein